MLLLGGRSACVSLDSAVVNAKCVRACVCAWARVCVCVGLIDGAVNTGVHLGGVTARMKLSEHYTLQSEGNE